MRTIALLIVDEANEFQRLLAAEAATAAREAGFEIEVRAGGSGGNELAAQLKLVDRWLAAATLPAALLVLAARDRGLGPSAREAARRGVHWIGLNRTDDDLDAVRRESPRALVATVCPDERQTGAIQARLVRSLLPEGGRVLYVTGGGRSLTARERAEGFREGLSAGAHDIVRLEAGWSAAEAHAATAVWLRIALRARRRLDAIACQNDALAEGVLRSLHDVRTELGCTDFRPPVVGCDGTPLLGQRLVTERRLAATVVVPRVATTAIGLLAASLQRGMPLPALTALAPSPWPEDLLCLRPSA